VQDDLACKIVFKKDINVMKRIQFVFYLLYRYYSTAGKKKEVAYLATISAFLLIIFSNVFTIFCLLNLTQLMFSFLEGPRWLGALKAICFTFIPGYILLSQIFKEKDIRNLHYEEAAIKKGNIVLISYIIFSFLSVMIVSIIKGPTK
jgi:hypothetical protein